MILKTTFRERTDANIVRNHGLAYMEVWNSYTQTHTHTQTHEFTSAYHKGTSP